MTDALVTQDGEVLPDAARVRLGIVHGNTPDELVAFATSAANSLAGVIENRKLYSVIQGKRFVRCEGWTTLAAMMGFIPREVSNVIRVEDGAYEATVELVRLSDGLPLARATAECGKDEPTWAKRPGYARRSMAATRATSKACRQAFSWVMALTGFEVTPAEEIPENPTGKDAPDRRGYPTRGPEIALQVPAQPLSEMPAALEEDDRGEVLESKPLSDLLLLVAKAGISKAAFPEWYTKVTGQIWDKWVYEGDVAAIRSEAAKLLARKAKP